MEMIFASLTRDAASTSSFYRHPVTTYWLRTMVIMNILYGVFLLVTLFFGSSILSTSLVIPLTTLLTAVGAYWLLRWKKRGFYLIVGSLIIHLALNMIKGDPFMILRGLANLTTSLGLLYMVLQIGNVNKPWDHLN
jgi:hypothetical protein